jgi:hypothetical protein
MPRGVIVHLKFMSSFIRAIRVIRDPNKSELR